MENVSVTKASSQTWRVDHANSVTLAAQTVPQMTSALPVPMDLRRETPSASLATRTSSYRETCVWTVTPRVPLVQV